MPQLFKAKPSASSKVAPSTKAKAMPSTDHTEAKSTGENNKLPSFPMHAPKDDYNDFQKHAEMQTKYLKMHNVVGGRKRRRKSRKKRSRRRRRSRRGGVPRPSIALLPEGLNSPCLQQNAQRRCSPLLAKINEIIRALRATGAIMQGGGSRILQHGGQKGSYGKPGIGSEASLCGAFQTPEEIQYTPDKYIVVPQPAGSSGGPLAANDITVNLAKALTQARANSEGDFSVVDTAFQDDRQDVGNIKLPKGGRRRRRRRKSRKKKHQRRRRSRRQSRRRRRRR